MNFLIATVLILAEKNGGSQKNIIQNKENNKIVIKLLLSKVRLPIDVLFPTHNRVIEAGKCFKSAKAPQNVIFLAII